MKKKDMKETMKTKEEEMMMPEEHKKMHGKKGKGKVATPKN